jgi:hypothetical protein
VPLTFAKFALVCRLLFLEMVKHSKAGCGVREDPFVADKAADLTRYFFVS